MDMEMTSYDDWVRVDKDFAEWVFINPVGGEETIADADGGFFNKRMVLKNEPDLDGDGNKDQNLDRGGTKRTDGDEAQHGFCAPLIFCEAGFSAHPGRAPQYGREPGFCKAEAWEHADEKGAVHMVSSGSLLVEAVHEDGNEHGHFDIERAEEFSGDACSQGGGDDYDYEEEEEGDDDDDEYSEELHEGALEDEEGIEHTNSLIDAVERYYTNPTKVGWQEYVCSVQTETRRELHEAKMIGFRGYGPQPRPFLEGSTCFNPLFEQTWLPWAIGVEYCHDEDLGLLVFGCATGFTQCSLAANVYTTSAVATLPVLEYMVNRSSGKKIAHLGQRSSWYWAALLHQLGALNVIVTEGSCTAPVVGSLNFEQVDEDTFFELDMAAGCALFFLRPLKRSQDVEPCMAERCLFCFPGDTIFFVGERGKHADNFDMAGWVEEHAPEGWWVEKEMEIPCWPGSHDVFLCITKANMPLDMTT